MHTAQGHNSLYCEPNALFLNTPSLARSATFLPTVNLEQQCVALEKKNWIIISCH